MVVQHTVSIAVLKLSETSVCGEVEDSKLNRDRLVTINTSTMVIRDTNIVVVKLEDSRS